MTCQISSLWNVSQSVPSIFFFFLKADWSNKNRHFEAFRSKIVYKVKK